MSALALLVAVSLSGAPNKPTKLSIDVKPETAVVFVDGARKGTGKRTILITVTPGRHKLKVTNGKDADEEYVVVKKGETTSWKYEFEDDKPPSHKPPADDGAAAPEKSESPDKADAPESKDAPPSDDMDILKPANEKKK